MDSDHYYDSLWAEFLSGKKESANSVEDTWTINQGWTTHQLWICRGPDFHSQHPCGLDSSQSPLSPATGIWISFSDLLWRHFTHPHKPARRHRCIHAVLLKIVFKNPVSCLMLLLILPFLPLACSHPGCPHTWAFSLMRIFFICINSSQTFSDPRKLSSVSIHWQYLGLLSSSIFFILVTLSYTTPMLSPFYVSYLKFYYLHVVYLHIFPCPHHVSTMQWKSC